MVGLTVSRLVILIAGLWRAPVETEVTTVPRTWYPYREFSEERSQTRLTPDFQPSTIISGPPATLMATTTIARRHERGLPKDIWNAVATHSDQDMSLEAAQIGPNLAFPPFAPKFMLRPPDLDADLEYEYVCAAAELIGTPLASCIHIELETEHLSPFGAPGGSHPGHLVQLFSIPCGSPSNYRYFVTRHPDSGPFCETTVFSEIKSRVTPTSATSSA